MRPEVFFSVSEELRLFGLSLLAGAVIGVVFDVFRAFRLILRHSPFLVLAEDIAFLCGYAVFLPAFASAEARGTLRLYFAIGNGIGFTLYFFTVGRFVLGTLKKLFTAFGTVLGIIFKPLKALYALICKKANRKFVECNKSLVKFIKKPFLHLQTQRKLLYNKQESLNRKNVNDFVQKGNKRKNKTYFKKESKQRSV